LTPNTAKVKVGDSFPSGITLYQFNPDGGVKEVKTDDIINNQSKVVIFGVPGAFTPGCTQRHLPSFVKRADEIKQKGYNDIICVAVNDPFVMYHWGDDNNATGKIRMVGDPEAKLAQALGLDKVIAPFLGTRTKRFSAIVENGKITQLNVEPDAGTSTTCSLAPELKL